MKSGSSAGFGRRIAAFAYDALLVAALVTVYTAVVVSFTRNAGRPQAVLPETVGSWAYLYYAGEVVVIGGYSVFNWLHSGQTLGMRAWRLHVVDAAGRRLRPGRALLRLVCAVLAWAPSGLGVLWLYLDTEGLALQDRLSGTRVVHISA